MNGSHFVFNLGSSINRKEAEDTLLLASIAAEGLHGEAKVRTEVSQSISPFGSEITVSGQTPVTTSVAQIYTALLTREFGRDAFRVSHRPYLPEATTCD